jgi:hypothetical protein
MAGRFKGRDTCLPPGVLCAPLSEPGMSYVGADLQTTADGSKREREGRDEGRKRY